MKDDERRAAYACDITYVTNNELGFDYLRDNMAIYKEQIVLRGLKLLLLSMRSIQFLSMKPEHRLLFQDRAASQQSFMNCVMYLLVSL